MDPALAIDALPPIDIVLLSHNHYDHLDKPSVKRIARAHPNATWIVPLRLGATIAKWGAREIRELDWWQCTQAGSASVTATPARHFSARGLFDRNSQSPDQPRHLVQPGSVAVGGVDAQNRGVDIDRLGALPGVLGNAGFQSGDDVLWAIPVGE